MADTQKPKQSGTMEQYIGPPFLSHVNKFVKEEFHRRAVKRVRPVTPFVKAIPGFNFNDDIHKKLILKGIADIQAGVDTKNYQFKNLYRAERSFRPLPGITSLSVEYKNVTGAIRKGKMAWVCHTLQDLEEFSPFFLNPGRTVMLEWGWSDIPVGILLNDDDKYFDTYSLRDYYKTVRDKIIQSKGNYDAMLGVITNYEFSMNPDGGYNCSTEVTAVGDLMRGIEIANQHTIKADWNLNALERDKKITPTYIETLRQFVESTLESQVDLHSISSKFTDTNDSNDTYILRVMGKNLKNTKEYQAATEGKNTTFLSWGYIEDYIINSHTLIRYGEAGDDNSPPLFLVDSSLSKFRWNDKLRSTDLDICIIPKTLARPEEEKSLFFPPKCDSKNNDMKYCSPRKILINMDFFIKIVLSAKTLDDVITNTWSKVNDACVNFWLVKVKTISDEMDVIPQNKIYLKEGKRPSVLISVVDYNYSDMEIKSENAFQFKVFPDSPIIENTKYGKTSTSIMRSINLSSKLSNDAAVNVFYSVNSTDARTLGNQVSLWTSLFDYNLQGTPTDDFIKDGLNISTRQPPSDEREKISEKQGEYWKNIQEIFEEMSGYNYKLLVFLPVSFRDINFEGYINPNYASSIIGGYETRNFGEKGAKGTRFPDKLSIGREVMREELQKDTESETIAANKQAVIPLTCDIELEGISGFRCGDVFTIDNIPDTYKNKGVFQIVNISHDVDKTTWKTKLKASFRIFAKNPVTK